MPSLPILNDVLAAAPRIAPHVAATPVLHFDFVPDTICDGLRGTLGQPDFEVLRAPGTQVVVVAAMRLLGRVLKQTVEPSSAAVLAQPERFSGKRVGLVLSGGNVDIDALPWSGA